jgi:hypothetical protein
VDLEVEIGETGLLELTCPICTGLIEAGDGTSLIEEADRHTRGVHGVHLPCRAELAAAIAELPAQ